MWNTELEAGRTKLVSVRNFQNILMNIFSCEFLLVYDFVLFGIVVEVIFILILLY